jgi:hypothetical protein
VEEKAVKEESVGFQKERLIKCGEGGYINNFIIIKRGK